MVLMLARSRYLTGSSGSNLAVDVASATRQLSSRFLPLDPKVWKKSALTNEGDS